MKYIVEWRMEVDGETIVEANSRREAEKICDDMYIRGKINPRDGEVTFFDTMGIGVVED